MTSRSTSAPVHYTGREILNAMVHPAVIVGALGYFVDIYDLVLFLIVRTSSLTSLGLSGDQLVDTGAWLLNWQMGGMMVGGLLWGLLGDRFGRLKVLFGSIILYSLANIANSFVHDVGTYTVCRFLAGVGLAGELGGCITLVCEVLPLGLRGYGTMVVSAIGVLGAVVGGSLGLFCPWRTMFLIGGGMGLALLVLRVIVNESGMFRAMKDRPSFGSQLALLVSPGRIGRYLCCILIGVPCWYVVGLVIAFSPEFGRNLGATGPIVAGTAVKWAYGGICVGDLASNLLCQAVRNRKGVLLGFLLAAFGLSNLFFFLHQPSPGLVYGVAFVLGISVGYWSVFVTIAAEHFGTNMRATTATTVSNFVRAAVIPLTTIYAASKPHFGAIPVALALGWVSFAVAFLGWWGLRETFHDDLDYLEE
ncbi:MAG TPA: MFS transporter [Candidatus Methylacidiphilales bacterium]|jgi:MFS family permease|nr:MFS transporter [Candidatus Methylacidiphilales bacterium]